MASNRKKPPKSEPVVVDPVPGQADAVEFLKDGTAGFVPNDSTLDDFLNTIRSAAKGIKVRPPPVAGSLLSQMVEHAILIRDSDQIANSTRMTQREQEVIDQIAQGRSNKEIAENLGITVHMVTSHLHDIIAKLSLHIRLVLMHHVLTDDEIEESS